MKITKCFSAIALILLAFAGCKEDTLGPLTKKGAAPQKVSNVTIKPRPGGAKFNYTVPNDEDLLYVKAVYETSPGHTQEVKASVYVDSLVIVGFGDTKPHEVKLYSVSRSEVKSEPVSVMVTPLTAPVKLVRASLSLTADFGGVSVSFLNDLGANIAINVVVKDAAGDWITLETFYTDQKKGQYAARGQASVPAEFGVFIRDRYSNYSDTLKATLTPIFEKQLSAPAIVKVLASDKWRTADFYMGYVWERMFDKVVDKSSTNMAHTNVGTVFPVSFTLDFGAPTKFSRFKYWMRGLTAGENQTYLYNSGNPEVFELYGSNVLDDNFASWTKITEYKIVKPSGLPLGTSSNADIATAAAGLDLTFPSNTPAFRYIRWKTTKNFGTVNYIHIAELAFFGQ